MFERVRKPINGWIDAPTDPKYRLFLKIEAATALGIAIPAVISGCRGSEEQTLENVIRIRSKEAPNRLSSPVLIVDFPLDRPLDGLNQSEFPDYIEGTEKKLELESGSLRSFIEKHKDIFTSSAYWDSPSWWVLETYQEDPEKSLAGAAVMRYRMHAARVYETMLTIWQQYGYSGEGELVPMDKAVSLAFESSGESTTATVFNSLDSLIPIIDQYDARVVNISAQPGEMEMNFTPTNGALRMEDEGAYVPDRSLTNLLRVREIGSKLPNKALAFAGGNDPEEDYGAVVNLLRNWHRWVPNVLLFGHCQYVGGRYVPLGNKSGPDVYFDHELLGVTWEGSTFSAAIGSAYMAMLDDKFKLPPEDNVAVLRDEACIMRDGINVFDPIRFRYILDQGGNVVMNPR